MRKLFIATMLCLASFTGHLQAQSVTLTEEQYKSLPSDVRKQIDKEIAVETVSKYAGLGKEIGEGVNSALMAIEGSAERISNTTIGKTAIGVVVWKFIAKDAIRFILGIFFAFIGISVSIFVMRKHLPKRNVSEIQYENGKKKTIKYSLDSGDSDFVTGGLVCMFITIITSCLIMFV